MKRSRLCSGLSQQTQALDSKTPMGFTDIKTQRTSQYLPLETCIKNQVLLVVKARRSDPQATSLMKEMICLDSTTWTVDGDELSREERAWLWRAAVSIIQRRLQHSLASDWLERIHCRMLSSSSRLRTQCNPLTRRNRSHSPQMILRSSEVTIQVSLASNLGTSPWRQETITVRYLMLFVWIRCENCVR